MNKLIKSVVTLVSICLAVTLMMAVTNWITAPIIAENEKASANKALLEVMPEGKSFEELDISGYTLPSTVTNAYKAEAGGYVVKLTTTGYSSGFVIMCGVNADGTVSGAVCLSSTETLGYEKSYGENFTGKNSEEVDGVDTISGATKTTAAYKSAVKDAINAATILGGGDVDIRTEEEILADNLAAALPAANGEFEKHFFAEVTEGVDAIYTAKNGSGFVCLIGEAFIGIDADSNVITDCADEDAAKATAAIAAIQATVITDIDIAKFQGLPTHLTSAKKTASGNYILEMNAAGYGIVGGDQYHPASGEYIKVKISLTAEGMIIDCLTLYQNETKGIGDACADEKFYGQFDGKTEQTYQDIDAISGATLTTDGYKKAILRAFESLKILKGGAK